MKDPCAKQKAHKRVCHALPWRACEIFNILSVSDINARSVEISADSKYQLLILTCIERALNDIINLLKYADARRRPLPGIIEHNIFKIFSIGNYFLVVALEAKKYSPLMFRGRTN